MSVARLSFFSFFIILSFHSYLFSQNSSSIQYQLSMPQPHTHYFNVKMSVSGIQKDSLNIKLPVWAPGSYLVREFSRNVEDFEVKDQEGSAIDYVKTSKNTWTIDASGLQNFTITYKVYAYETSVRTSFLDATHGFVHGTSIFMYVEDLTELPITLEVVPFKEWSKVSTGLKKLDGKGFNFKADNYDQLVDAPIQIGNHKIISFKAGGISHDVAMVGMAEYDERVIVRDLTKIIESAIRIFNHNPNDYYLFIVHNLDNRGGGLEHHNSTTLQLDRWAYSSEHGYNGFLKLATHEYFHLWWVKRARPFPLGPFNYDQENYTTLLWAMEGFTSYYEDIILRRSGFYDDNDYLNSLMNKINYVENVPGSKVQSVAMASFDTWIKFYRPDENSNNSSISYYSKGAVLGALLDLEIINATKGQKKLDHALRNLYQKYYLTEKRGFTEQEFQQAIEEVAGKSMEDFFSKYIYDAQTIDYNKFFNYAGLKISHNLLSNEPPALGINISEEGGKLLVESVVRGSSAYDGGINAHDEILAIDGYRASFDLIEKFMNLKKRGDEVTVLVARNGLLHNLTVKLKEDSFRSRYTLSRISNPTALQLKVFNTWLGGK